MEAKRACEQVIEMRELVLPNDTNLLGNLLGGRLMHWVDLAGAMAAQRFASAIVATVAIDSLDFRSPAKVGSIMTLKARLTWAGRTSMETLVEVFAEDYLTGEIVFTNRAYMMFVAVDSEGHPVEVPKLLIETEEEKLEFARAEQRRADRLARRGR